MTTIRRHVQRLIGGMVLVLGIACAMGSYLLLSWLAEHEVNQNAHEMARQAELELDRLLLPPTSLLNLLSNVPGLKTGRLSDWIARLPAQSSLLRANPMLESVYVGGPDGEYLNLREIKNQYDRKRFAVGSNVAWLIQAQRTKDMHADGQLRLGLNARFKVVTRRIDLAAKDYDPRKRIWYQEAIGAGRVIRTQPYLFYSSGREGITLARSMGNGFVAAMDINLESLSPRLKQLAAEWSSRFWLFDHHMRLIVAGRQEGNTDPLFSYAHGPLPSALRNGGWVKDTTGKSWWIGSTHVRLDGRNDMILRYAVPRTVILGEAETVRDVLLAITMLMLVIMLYAAKKIALRFSRPLELLAQASERVGQLEFQERTVVESGIAEVKQLADVHERTRIMLLENQERINEQQNELITQLQALHQAEQRLEQLNADLSATLMAVPDLLFELSDEGRYINVWARNPELLAAQKEILLGHTISEMLPAEAAETVMSAIQEASAEGTSFGRVIALDLPDGRHWFELSASAKSEADHAHHTFMMLSRDITERIKANEALRESEQRYRTLIDVTSAVTWTCHPSGLHVRPEPQWMAFTGQSAEEMLGSSWTKFVHPDDLTIVSESWRQAVETEQPYSSEHRIRRHDGEWRWVKVYAVPIRTAEDEVIEWFGMNLDITERKEAEERIEHLAFHDPLTGLANRVLFLDRLNQALAIARRTQRYGAIIFIDLDLFKKINDVFGHVFGDKVLKKAADNLRQLLRESDTVARLGGDEFVILLPGLSDDEETAIGIALTVAEKVRTALEEASRIDDQSYSTSASLGISLFPRQHETVDDLIREADIAMYRAKERGRNTLVFFEDDMQVAISERFALEQALRAAVKQDGLELFLQSKVDRAGKVIGAESLVRWRHPTKGLILPATFIPLAEETGLIGAIGEWVLRETCKLIVRLNATGRSLHMAVNVSPRQFHLANFVALVKRILAETGADPLCLTLEITENLLVERTSEVVSRMLELAELGIRFSIDDFGTGYSSLAYLKRLPLNELKIDKSFVQDIPQDINDVALVETILSMAHHLGFEVVAEGVETEDQFEFLTTRRCTHFQGYLFHRPQPAHEWLASLETGEG